MNHKLPFLAAGIILTVSLSNCKKDDPDLVGVNFRQEMRTFVQEISTYARTIEPSFVIIPQNGHQLVSLEKDQMGTLVQDYVDAIDGMGREDLYYGYDNDDKATSAADRNEMIPYLDAGKDAGLTILVTDYCSTPSKMDDSYAQNAVKGYLSFAADHRGLDNIPGYPNPIVNENSQLIESLADAQNMLFLIDPSGLGSKTAFINAVSGSNYDVVITDYFFDGQEYTAQEITQLKQKANGGEKLLISYMSIGEAEDYRFYWNSDWKKNPPAWLDKENKNWKGNYKVKYWFPQWKSVITGNADSYLHKIVTKGFDGVYLDIIDAFEYYEDQTGQ